MTRYSKEKAQVMYDIATGLQYVDAYLRYSSKNQDDGVSIEMQQDKINEYCSKNNLVIRRWYIDTATSATKKKAETRDAFYNLIQDINNSDTAGTLILYSTSRAFRNSYESHKYRKFFREKGIKLLSATQHIDEDTSSGRLTTSILSDIDQYKSEELSDYVKGAIRALVKRGFYIGSAVPFGYTVVPAVDDAGKPRKKYAIHEEEAAAVKQIFSDYAEGVKPRIIADNINAKGFRTKRGNTFCSDSIRKLILNDFYIGTRRVQLQDQDEIVIEKAVEPLIDLVTFDACQQIRINRNQSNVPRSKWKKNCYLLTGKIVCSECSERIGEPHYMVGKVKHTISKGNRYTYNYYACYNKHKYKICTCKPVRKEHLEEYVLQQVKEKVLNEGLIEAIADEVMKTVKNVPAPASDIKKLLKRKNEVIAEIAELAIMKAKKEIDEETFIVAKKPLDDEKAQLDIDIYMSEENKKRSIDREFITEKLRSMIADAESGEPETLQALFENVVDRIEVDNDKVIVHLVIYFTRFVPNGSLRLPNYSLSTKITRKELK